MGRFFLLVSGLAWCSFALATPVLAVQQGGTEDCGEFGCFEAPLPGINTQSIDDFIENDQPFSTLVATIANFLIGLIVAVGLIMMVIGGYVYMTAGGSGDRVSLAKGIIGAALLGIFLALASYLILNTISGQFFREPDLPTVSTDDNSSGGNALSARALPARIQGLCDATSGSCPVGASAEFCAARAQAC